MRYASRSEAGRLLAKRIDPVRFQGAAVVAISASAVPIADEIARWLQGALIADARAIDPSQVHGKKVVLVDDVVTNGIKAVRIASEIEDGGPQWMALATPVGLSSTLVALEDAFDEVFYLGAPNSVEDPRSFYAA